MVQWKEMYAMESVTIEGAKGCKDWRLEKVNNKSNKTQFNTHVSLIHLAHQMIQTAVSHCRTLCSEPGGCKDSLRLFSKITNIL